MLIYKSKPRLSLSFFHNETVFIVEVAGHVALKIQSCILFSLFGNGPDDGKILYENYATNV